MSITRTTIVMIGLLMGLALISSLTGCGGGGGNGPAAPATDPPTISMARVDLPDGFSFMGGNVTLKAQVDADAGVSSVTASVEGPGSPTDVSLVRSPAGYYWAVYKAAANPSSTGTPQAYTVVFTVTDELGRRAISDPVRFYVPAPPGPPPPP